MTWTQQILPSSIGLRGVSFTDANTGTVVGDSGTILRTTDGGTTWTRQPAADSQHPLYAVSFTDPDTGTVVGFGGTILRTTTGGTSTGQLKPSR